MEKFLSRKPRIPDQLESAKSENWMSQLPDVYTMTDCFIPFNISPAFGASKYEQT